LTKESLDYGARLTAEWQRYAVDAMRRSAELAAAPAPAAEATGADAKTV
jgi:hypothetical protein